MRECAVYVCMMHLTITLTLHIHSLLMQCFLGGKPRGAYPEVYDLSPPLTV